MALSGAAALLRPQTALQQLLEEINFQRAKEMRQLLKDDGGFVVLQGTTYWTDLFVRHFLFQAEVENSIDSDDLLFFVRKKYVKGSSRHMPKFETNVDVHRKDSRKLPVGDPDVDWEETVYLNLIIHQFNYTLTLAICTRTSPKELQVLRRHSQRVYASPSRRKMDTKGDGEEMTYPHICFMVDNFDEVFCDIMVRDGEMVCVELVANDRDGTVQGVIFLGSIRYDALKKVYDARQSSISSKLAQRMTFGLFSGGGPQTRCEFVRMKGPQGKGHAEMAVTKPKGSGVETPTSEPGFCMTDMYDEWDEDPDDFLYRHQRRLSDPSANLNNFSRHGWKAKGPIPNEQSSKAMSQNEGLDSLASEVSEIEAGDLKDDERSASPCKTEIIKSSRKSRVRTSSETTSSLLAKTTTCCNCFGPLKSQWNDNISGQMSDVYCRSCENEVDDYDDDFDEENVIHIPKNRLDSPAILTNVTKPKAKPKMSKNKNKPNQRSNNPGEKGLSRSIKELEMSLRSDVSSNENSENPRDINDEFELGDDVATETPISNSDKIIETINTKDLIRVRGKEEFPAATDESNALPYTQNICNQNDNSNSNSKSFMKQHSQKIACTDDHPLLIASVGENELPTQRHFKCEDFNGNGITKQQKGNAMKQMQRRYSTLPKMKQSTFLQRQQHAIYIANGPPYSIPTRHTADGTTIYYLCDLNKQVLKELDDGAYNPLWTTKGFTQTFHFWKEHRRQQSVPLNAFLTYVTLPWWSIAKDLLDHRETPILTF